MKEGRKFWRWTGGDSCPRMWKNLTVSVKMVKMINFVLRIFHRSEKQNKLANFCFRFEVGAEEAVSETINYEEALPSKETGYLTKPQKLGKNWCWSGKRPFHQSGGILQGRRCYLDLCTRTNLLLMFVVALWCVPPASKLPAWLCKLLVLPSTSGVTWHVSDSWLR